MDLQITGKLAVVTGSTGDGIGSAIALELARQGAVVVVNGRSQSTVDETVGKITEKCQGAEVCGIVGDLGTEKGVDEFIIELTRIEQENDKKVDILINNVGIFHSQDFVDIPDAKWMDYYNINVLSGMRLSRHFLPRMLERNNNGRIIFISSEAGLRALPHMLPYSVSKTSQICLARGLAEMTKGTTVTVNSLLPGPTMTGGVRSYMQEFAAQRDIPTLEQAVQRYFAEFETTSLLQRFLDPTEVANVAVFMSSPLASGINGAAQLVEGGIVRHI